MHRSNALIAAKRCQFQPEQHCQRLQFSYCPISAILLCIPISVVIYSHINNISSLHFFGTFFGLFIISVFVLGCHSSLSLSLYVNLYFVISYQINMILLMALLHSPYYGFLRSMTLGRFHEGKKRSKTISTNFWFNSWKWSFQLRYKIQIKKSAMEHHLNGECKEQCTLNNY